MFLSKNDLTESQLFLFKLCLCNVTQEHLKDHWYPDNPLKGNAHRCIRMHKGLDPLVAKAAIESGIKPQSLQLLFPEELTVWIDPGTKIWYRIGDLLGSIGEI